MDVSEHQTWHKNSILFLNKYGLQLNDSFFIWSISWFQFVFEINEKNKDFSSFLSG